MKFSLSPKRFLTAILLPAYFAFALISAPAAAEGPTGPAGPALWKLTDHDSEIWLFGTVHILDPNLSWHSQRVTDAFETADIVYFEIPSDPETDQQVQALIPKYGLNPPGVSLSSLLSEAGKQHFAAALQSLGMPATATANFEPFRPWLAGVSVAAIQMQARGLDPEAGVEKILTKAAVKAGKSLAFLETPEQQLALFGNLSSATEVAFFEEGMRQLVEDPDALDDITADWAVGNAAGVGKKLQEAMDDPVLYAALLTDRNENWAAQIKKMMDGSGKIFIAVGAGHLAGKGSVQDYLASYQLKAVRQ